MDDSDKREILEYTIGSIGALAFAMEFGLAYPPPDEPGGPSPTFPTVAGDTQVQTPVDGDALLLEARCESTPEILALCRYDGKRTIRFLGWATGESLRAARTAEREGELVHILTSIELRPMEEFQMLLLAEPGLPS